ncbi:membrane protein [Pseudochelatococcus lubricantis]|uniref:Membrane protein n=1 Tax=Pseudochelatococcus lubricantis TaxID=1538102 RepID=A0ABX0V2A7_9HYPH|nr:YihY/virulence factor BrkB family protein [Pseudochelatococcus lubricantis]NIJ59358.1 membrane protein [Pseudochelatococcus lubricantis]
MDIVTRLAKLIWMSFRRFDAHDGWAIASHIALSALMSLFPFVILIAALASTFQAEGLADSVTDLMLEAWPQEVAGPIGRELHHVLTIKRGDLLTVGALLALYFSSNGVEALRIGLNRAYDVTETRPWWLTRLEAFAYVIGGAAALIVFSFLVVLGPLLWRTLVEYVPALQPLHGLVFAARFSVATLVIVIALFVGHLWLPSERARRKKDRLLGERRTLLSVLPGVAVTLVLWLVGGTAFGLYLDSFARNYVSTYAGLASGMIVLVFLYMLAAIFIYGAELNASIAALRRKARENAAAQEVPLAPEEAAGETRPAQTRAAASI